MNVNYYENVDNFCKMLWKHGQRLLVNAIILIINKKYIYDKNSRSKSDQY